MNCVHILHAGYCTAPEHIAIQGGAWRQIRFPAMFALIEHPRFGPMLFDTGYSYHFFEETRKFPNRFYRWMTPVTLCEKDLATNQLSTFNIQPTDISRIFISHFHADHIAALGDFDRARFVYLPHAYENIRFTRGLGAVSKAFMPGLLPGDFDERSTPVDMSRPMYLPGECTPFQKGYDLLGDESVIAVELPGHALGQMGLFARAENDRLIFFVADAAWLKRAIVENRPPHRIADLLFDDGKTYRNTLNDLYVYHSQHPNVEIVPSHCEETIRANAPHLPKREEAHR